MVGRLSAWPLVSWVSDLFRPPLMLPNAVPCLPLHGPLLLSWAPRARLQWPEPMLVLLLALAGDLRGGSLAALPTREGTMWLRDLPSARSAPCCCCRLCWYCG